MKAVIYARYSSDSQREESIEGQLRECTEYAERNGITILRSYIDRALSARTADRPEFQNMIKDSEQKLFDVVLIWKLDRFSRDRYDSAHYKRILKKNGVKVVSVKENISDGPEGIILESMLEGYAEYYSAELSEKIQRGQKENALKCKNNGGNTPLGYVVGTDGVLAVDPLTAPLVTEIFTRYDSGESISEITASLNGRGLKTKKGKAFKIGGVSLILKNRKYIGEYQYGSVIIPKGIPAIIDDDLFDRVQRRMAFNKKAPAKAKATEEYLLTTKLFCGTCERLMAGESGTSSTKGVKHYYYKCGGAKRKLGCKRKAVRKHWIERAAVLVTVQQSIARRGNQPHCRQHPCLAKQRGHHHPGTEKTACRHGARNREYAERNPEGSADQFHKRTFGGSGKTKGQPEDSRPASGASKAQVHQRADCELDRAVQIRRRKQP